MVFRDQPAHTLANAAPAVVAELEHLRADLALALCLLDQLTPSLFIEGFDGPSTEAHTLLVRHGIRPLATGGVISAESAPRVSEP